MFPDLLQVVGFYLWVSFSLEHFEFFGSFSVISLIILFLSSLSVKKKFICIIKVNLQISKVYNVSINWAF